jgi:hypothetical protein
MKQKVAALLITFVLAASSLLMATPVRAETPKPSVPEFIVETVSSPYDVPPTTTTTIDPYTGKETVTTQSGYHVENKTTQIKIRNQPFTSTKIQENGQEWTLGLCYNIRFKGHFSTGWSYYRLHNCSSDGNLWQASSSGYTIVLIDEYLPNEGQMDFQIEALVGYEQGIVTCPGAPGTARVVTGETSGWSPIQTAEIKDKQITASSTFPPCTPPPITPTPTTTTTQTLTVAPTETITRNTVALGLSWEQVVIAVMASVIAALAAALVLTRRKRT